MEKKQAWTRWFPKDEPISSEPFGKVDYLCGLLVLFVSFGVYLVTLTPTVGFHDSGELITIEKGDSLHNFSKFSQLQEKC